MPTLYKYGLGLTADDCSQDEFDIHFEFEAIRRGGRWGKNKENGLGLLQHYLNAHKLLWPEDDQHRWLIQGMRSIVEHWEPSIFLGSASSNKTTLFCYHSLITFWVFPFTSFAIISSTDRRALEQKIWGRIKSLFNRGKSRFPCLYGVVLESSMAITPDEIDDEGEKGRLLDRGIACVPCVSGGRFVGMGKYQGAKPPHTPGKFDGKLTHYGDEAAVMQTSFLDAYTNWMVNNAGPIKAFKGVMGGNPTDISDPLCTAAEPVGGWDSFIDTGKTQEWTSRWYEAHVVAFDGRDSPNNDQPGTKYPYLISKPFIDSLIRTFGEDSWQLYQQGIGKPSRGMVSNRVITIGLCERHKAFDNVVWRGEPRTKLYAVDPAFGGGDRCVGMEIDFGLNLQGEQVLSIGSPEIIPIQLNSVLDAEAQIAKHMKNRSNQLKIPASQMAYDSFGRGTLGFALAKEFGSDCPVPIDSGGPTTDRPVRFDLYVDEKKGMKRLKTCHEHYSKFVTEMWFSVREGIESNQVRNLPMEVAREGQLRLFRIVMGNKIEVESKDDMKERVKKSPDLFDCLAIGVELARRLGFKIERIGREVENSDSEQSYFDKEAKEWNDALKSGLLKH